MSVELIEKERIAALNRYEILDTPQDGSFNRLTKLASRLFNVPIAIISLVDTDRIWFKSHYGLAVNQIQPEPGLCTSAILSDEVYVVEDARNDPRTLTNSLVVSEFGLQFYAAAPLRTSDGYNLGTLCIIDRKQRYITEAQKEILKEVAAIAMDEMEIRLAARKNARKATKLVQETLARLEHTATIVKEIPGAAKNEELALALSEAEKLTSQLQMFLKQQE